MFDDFSEFRLRIGQLVGGGTQVSSFGSSAIPRSSVEIIGIIQLDKLESLVFLRRSGIAVVTSGLNPVGSICRTKAIDLGLSKVATKEIIGVVMYVPTVGITVSDFLRAKIALAAVSLEKFFHGLMAAALAPDVRGHVANIDKRLFTIVTYGVSRENNTIAIVTSPRKRLLNFHETLRLNFSVADRAAPDTTAGLQTTETCLMFLGPVKADANSLVDGATASRAARPAKKTAEITTLFVFFVEIAPLILECRVKVLTSQRGGGRIICKSIKAGRCAAV